MPLLQVPHLKPEAAPTGCSQLCIGSHDDARGPPWFSPWKSNKKWGSPCPGRPSPPSHWNGTGPESKQDLSPSLPQARGRACLRDGFFCCSVCLLVWSGTRRYSAWSSGGVGGGWRWRGWKVGEWRAQRRGGYEGCLLDEDVGRADLPSRWRVTCREATG